MRLGFLGPTDAKMTEKSKTVSFERRAGDSTALYYMHDWMIVLVLAIFAILTVWAAVIIYDYIQTARGKRRKKSADTILETEDEGTRSEDNGACVDSTEKHADVVPETLEAWETNGWRRNRLKWISTIDEEAENIEEIPVTNERTEQIESIQINNKDPETVEVPVTSEDVKEVERIPTVTDEVEHQVEMIPSLNILDVESTQEECELSHRHTMDTHGRPDVNDAPGDDFNLHVCPNGNPVDLLTDPNLEGPNDLCCEDPENVCGVAEETGEHLHVVKTSGFATEMILSDGDLPEVLPEHLCEAEIVEVECQRDMTCHVAGKIQEAMTEMVLTIKPLSECVFDTEMEEIVSHEDFTIPEDETVVVPRTDTEHQSEMEMEEAQCQDEDIRNRAVSVHTLDIKNLPELRLTDFSHEEIAILLDGEENIECPGDSSSQVGLGDTGNKNLQHVNDVQMEDLGKARPYDEKICDTLEHPSEKLTEKASDPELLEPDHICKEDMQEVQSDVNVCSHKNGRRDESEGMAREPDLKPDYIRDAVIEVQCPVQDFDVIQFGASAVKTQEESPKVASSQTEHVSGVKTVEIRDIDLSRHTNEVQEYEALDYDMRKNLVEELRHTDSDPHSCAVEGLSDAPNVARGSDVVSERDVEISKESVDTQNEESQEKIEINIMEATMDHNEWMAVSGTDTDCPSEYQLGSNGLSCNGYRAEIKEQPIDSCGSVDSCKFGGSGIIARSTDGGLQGKKMAAVLPIKTETVRVRFCVHYHTDSPWQELAVTGDQPELGNWKGFVSLERGQEGFWVGSVPLPVERQIEWKFVLVEDGRIGRWEECDNRLLEPGRGGQEVPPASCSSGTFLRHEINLSIVHSSSRATAEAHVISVMRSISDLFKTQVQ
ncbi:hypothetical protein UPYG_G00351740 [Umbra pygmaea]|uniref:CBM20 domain-containing protein n=1 Tax=Umbra pygmaea TaxID=75934 RepID=A0ABD0VYE3_UMBPY